jgi:hypothetical protein
MKTFTWLLSGVLIACGGAAKTSPSPTNAAKPSAGEGIPCTQEIALVCPDGQIDACEKAVADANAKAEETPPDDDDSGGTGTAMALDEGRMGVLGRAGNHRCVPR